MKAVQVVHCDVTSCAYNRDHACHALAVTIGYGAHPHCDTCVKSSARAGSDRVTASVGACKMDHCQYNQGLECRAPGGIRVGRLLDDSDCTTYTQRRSDSRAPEASAPAGLTRTSAFGVAAP